MSHCAHKAKAFSLYELLHLGTILTRDVILIL